jgi:hypothetical protein
MFSLVLHLAAAPHAFRNQLPVAGPLAQNGNVEGCELLPAR